MTDYDFLNESTTTPRISSISASQALRASSTQHASVTGPLPTGLDGLDDAICATTTSTPRLASSSGGIPRGSITEIYGPPGVGKTAISLNIAAKALTAGNDEKVIWIDTGSPIPKPRLKDFLISNLKSSLNHHHHHQEEEIEERLRDCISRFTHIRANSLPHLLSLFTHPPPNFPPQRTSLLIVDTISAPFQSYFPNATELKSRLGLTHTQQQSAQTQNQTKGQQGQKPNPAQTQLQWLLNRKWNVTSDMINKISKLAAGHHLAVVLLNQTHTKIKGQPRPTLYPALAGGSWENCVQTRIVLYRDYHHHIDNQKTMKKKVRYAEIMKKSGKVVSVRVEGNVFPFVVEDDGLRELRPSTQSPRNSPPTETLSQSALTSTSAVTVRKRKVDEIADSEEEEEDDDDEFLDGQDDDFQWDEEHHDENSVPSDGQKDENKKNEL